MMTVITTMLAPPLLVKSFEGGSGLRKEMVGGDEDVVVIELELPSHDIVEFLRNQHVARMILLEELLALTDLLESTKQMKNIDKMGSDLMSGLFS